MFNKLKNLRCLKYKMKKIYNTYKVITVINISELNHKLMPGNKYYDHFVAQILEESMNPSYLVLSDMLKLIHNLFLYFMQPKSEVQFTHNQYFYSLQRSFDKGFSK